jgi:predicted secreted protein
MESAILFSSAGITELLVALPEPKKELVGSYSWSLPETPGMRMKLQGTFPNPHPTPLFETIKVYSVELTAPLGAATQPFNMVQATVHPPRVDLTGKVSMISHPYMTTVHVSCRLPLKSQENIPMMIAVLDRSGSTGYHWKPVGSGSGLKISSHTYPNPSQVAGAPATEIFFLTATEPGTHHIQIEQFGPNSKVAESSFVVAYTAY